MSFLKFLLFATSTAVAFGWRIKTEINLTLPDPVPVGASTFSVQPKPVRRAPSPRRSTPPHFFGCACFSGAAFVKPAAHGPDPVALLATAYREATAVEAWSLDTPIRSVPVIREPGEEIRFHRDREILGRFIVEDEAKLARFFGLTVDATGGSEDEHFTWLLGLEEPSLADALAELSFKPDLVFTFRGAKEARLEVDLRRRCVLVEASGQFGFFQLDAPARHELLEFFYALERGPIVSTIETPRYQVDTF